MRHEAYDEPDNTACMAIFQRELQHAERMVRLNLRHARQMESYVQTPGVVAKKRQYMYAVTSYRQQANTIIQRWVYFAKREKHARLRTVEDALGI